MSEVIARLRAEHANIARLIAALEAQVATFAAGGTPDYDLMAAALDYLAGYAARDHHPKEDMVFERLRVRDPASAGQIGELAESTRT